MLLSLTLTSFVLAGCRFGHGSPLETLAPSLSQEADAATPSRLQVDASAVDAFWDLVSELEDDREPTAEEWRALFGTPGWQLFVQTERLDTKVFEQCMRAAFMPSRPSYDAVGGWSDESMQRLIDGYRRVADDPELVRREVEAIRSGTVVEEALRTALEHLPETETEHIPAIALIIHPESRGYGPILYGLWARDDLRQPLIGELARQGRGENWTHVLGLAHELFHNLRSAHEEVYIPGWSEPDYDLFWILDQIQTEGLADRIDVTPVLEAGVYVDPWVEQEQSAQPRILAELDGILSGMPQSPTDAVIRDCGKRVRRLIPRSGHPTGYFMARVVQAELGEEPLVLTARDPYRFFDLYQVAARCDGTVPLFSDAAMRFLRHIEDWGREREQVRPKVLAVVPPLGASGVDPATEAIVFTFDRPMTGGYSFSSPPGTSCDSPEVLGVSWDDPDRTVCRLRVHLDPGRCYALELSGPGGFRGRDGGVPIHSHRVTFRTADTH